MITMRELKQLLIDSGIPPEELVAKLEIPIEELIYALEDYVADHKDQVVEEFFPELVETEDE